MSPPTKVFTTIIEKKQIRVTAAEELQHTTTSIDRSAAEHSDDGRYDLYLCNKNKCFRASEPHPSANMAKLFRQFKAVASHNKQHPEVPQEILFQDEKGEAYRLMTMDDGTKLPDEKAKAAAAMAKEFGM